MSRKTPSTVHPMGFWSGALLGTLTGMVSLLIFQYFTGILRRPRLISKAVVSGTDQFETQEALAMFILTESLRSGIQYRHLTNKLIKEVLHAGYRNFSESWARDFGFAAYGLLTLKEYNCVKETLEAFLWHQTPEGQLPVKHHSIGVVTRFLHSLFGREQPIEIPLKPKYVSGHGAPALDGQGMLVIAALAYVQETGNLRFLQNHWHELKSAMSWLESYRSEPAEDPLLHQGAFADWADSVARRGRVLYTNVIYWKALIEMAKAAKMQNLTEDSVLYLAKGESVSRAIEQRFWHAELGYFITSDKLQQLGSDGNLLAIAWGLAKADQAVSVLRVMEAAGMAEPVPTRVAFPSYPRELIALENLIGGMSNYHTDASWLWIGAWHIIALVKAGQIDEAEKLVERVLEVIVRDREVHEVHAPNGAPLSSIWYTPESPLTWNAGMVLYAFQVFENARERELKVATLINKITE